MAKSRQRKPATLSKAEKFYIESNSQLSLSELSEDTGKAQKLIKEHLAATQVDSERKVDSLMGKGASGAVVMTEAASSLADDKRDVSPDKTPARVRKFIHKIRE
tara:strand:- start:434 stop:745 length:312 start_codon:yes stop_codon:yes gene_type:complete